MSKVEVVLNLNGLKSLMNSDEIVAVLQEQADDIVRRCPGGVYETSQWRGKTRANVSIATYDRKTYFKNLRDNELLKALGGTRG